MPVFFNIPLNITPDKEVVWEASDEFRCALKILNKLKTDYGIVHSLENVHVSHLKKGNHSFIFLNEPKYKMTSVFGIFYCNEGTCKALTPELEVFSNGWSKKKKFHLGLYKGGAILEHTAAAGTKSRWLLTDDGWEKV